MSMLHFRAYPPRRGFTLVESLMALVVLAGAAAIVAQFATWSLAERARTDSYLETVDAAANVLEQARARSWNDLTPEWASGQHLPEHLATRWPDCSLSATVEPEPNQTLVKRVNVTVKWTVTNRLGRKPITLTSLFAARATEAKP